MERESPTNRYLKGLSSSPETKGIPEVDIHGTRFLVDVRNEEFREVQNPTNRIPFEALNETPTGHNTFFYDASTKNVYRGSIDEMTTSEHVRFTKLPSLWDLDREGMQQVTRELVASLRAERENRHVKTSGSEDGDSRQSNTKGRKP